MWNRNNYSRKFWDNLKRKCEQGKANLEGIVSISKIIYKETYIKAHGLRGWALVCALVSLSILRSTIAANAFSSNLENHTTQNFPMIAPRSVAKLSTSPKLTIFPPPVPYPFISDHCLKGDCRATLFLRNSIVAIDLKNLQTHKIWIILRGKTYVSINLLASTHLLLYRFKYIKLLQAKSLANFRILFSKKLFREIFIPSKILRNKQNLQKYFHAKCISCL